MAEDSFMAEINQLEDPNSHIFSFIDFDGEVGFQESPLSSPFLQTEDVLSPAHFTGSDLSSPDSQIAQQYTSVPTSILFDANWESIGSEMEEVTGMIPVMDRNVKLEVSKEIKQIEPEQDKKTKKGRGKKRQRSSNESTDVSAVILSRDQILTFSSEDLDQFTNNITSVRSLTYAEEKELKRQRRLIKNRESAQASRQRKKQYIDELEAEIAQLKGQNGQLSSQVGQLVIENRNLKEELQQLHTLVKKTGLIPPKPITPTRTEALNVSPQQKTKAGVCLLILLFSFGLFFNTEKGLARDFWGRSGTVIPQVIESLPAMAVSNMWANHGRRLQEVDLREKPSDPLVLSPKPQSNERVIVNPVVPPQRQTTPTHKITINERKENPERKRQFGATIGAPASSAYEEIHNRRTFSEKTHESQASPFMAEFAEMMNESINSNVSELHDAETQQWFSERLKARPNTAFFSVNDFQQIIPPDTQPFDSNSPFFVSLLIPARSLANQLPSSSNMIVDNSIIEVTCQVVGVNQTNLNLVEMNKIRQVPIMA